jgi:hypothetical protein
MAENEVGGAKTKIEADAAHADEKESKFSWLDLLKIVALPLVTLILGFVFNKSLNDRQAEESNARLYTEMMARREQADSDLRKDMFKSILDTFMSKNPKPEMEDLKQKVLNLELLAYNFHETLDIGPLFKDVRNRILDEKQGPHAALRGRLEKVAHEVIGRQLTVMSDSGMIERGSADPQKIDDLQAFLSFGAHTIPNLKVKPGEGVSRLCLSLDSTDGVRHYRQFTLEVIKQDRMSREVQVRLYVSQILDQTECQKADIDLEGKREIDSNFWVGLFDFPMIDNTHLTHGERCAVSLTDLTPDVITLALAYFPGSRAGLKDKPYYDEVVHDLVGHQKGSRPK